MISALGGAAILVATIVIGAIGLGYLLMNHRFWASLFYAIAYGALIAVIIIIFFHAEDPMVTISAHGEGSPASATYASVFGFALLAAILVLSVNDVRVSTVFNPPYILIPFALVGALLLPAIAASNNGQLWFASIAVGSAMFTSALVPVLAGLFPRNIVPRSLRGRVMSRRGTQTMAHLAFYVPIALFLASALACTDETVMVLLFAIAFYTATLGAAGVVYRSLEWAA